MIKKQPPIQYLIGALDTRGFFTIIEQERSDRLNNGCKKKWVNLFSFHTTKRLTCEFFKEEFGGYIYSEKKGATKHILYRWAIMGKKLTEFCQKVYPHLFLLKNDCELMMEFRETYIITPGYKLTDELIEKRIKLAAEFSTQYYSHKTF